MSVELANVVITPSSRLRGDSLVTTGALIFATVVFQPASAGAAATAVEVRCERCDAQEAARKRIEAKMPSREKWRQIVKRSEESGAAEMHLQEEDELDS